MVAVQRGGMTGGRYRGATDAPSTRGRDTAVQPGPMRPSRPSSAPRTMRFAMRRRRPTSDRARRLGMTHTTRIVTIRREARRRRARAAAARRGGGWRLPAGRHDRRLDARYRRPRRHRRHARRSASCRPGCPTRPSSTTSGSPSRRSCTTAPGRSSSVASRMQRRRVLAFDEIPKHRPRRDDGRGGPDVLGQRRHRRPGARSRPRPRTPRGPASAAHRRSPSSSSAPGCCRRTSCRGLGSLRPQGQGDHPVAPPERRATRARRASSASSRAYLNEIFYGHGAYGIAAAAEIYFGVSDLSKLTIAPGRAPRRAAEGPDDARSVPLRRRGQEGPADRARPDRRRSSVATGSCRASPRPGAGPTLDAGRALQTAIDEPVVLAGERPVRIPGGHFTWQVRRQLQAILGPDADLERGGYRVTHDARLARAAARREVARRRRRSLPNVSRRAAERILDALKIPHRRAWLDPGAPRQGPPQRRARRARLPDRATSWPTSAAPATPATTWRAGEFEPKYDAAGDGARQPGSAWKPILYAAAFDAKRLTPGSLLLDVTTEFDRRQDWAPRDADQLERGPVLVRRALQYSLNIPAIRALERVGNERVATRPPKRWASASPAAARRSCSPGWPGRSGRSRSARSISRRRTATIANGGVQVPPRMVLEVRAPTGGSSGRQASPPASGRSPPAAAYLVTDILPGNTDPAQNDIWAEKLQLRGRGRSPPAAGGGQDRHHQRRARSRARTGSCRRPRMGWASWSACGWATATTPTRGRSKPATSLTAAAPLWRAFMREYTREMAGHHVQAAQGRRPDHDRRLVGRPTRRLDSGHDRGVVHPRHPAGLAQGDRRGRPAVPDRRAAAGASTRSRRSSDRRPGASTSRTGCGRAHRGIGRRPAGTIRRPRTSGVSGRGAARSPASCCRSAERRRRRRQRRDDDGQARSRSDAGQARAATDADRTRLTGPRRTGLSAVVTRLQSVERGRATARNPST